MTRAAPRRPPPAGARPTNTPVISSLRAELRGIQSRLTRLDEKLSRLERMEPPGVPRPRSERYYQLLLAVYEHGRHGVDSIPFGQLGARYGYDRRGLGGFFAGRRAALRMTDDRVRVTPEGEELLQQYLYEHTP